MQTQLLSAAHPTVPAAHRLTQALHALIVAEANIERAVELIAASNATQLVDQAHHIAWKLNVVAEHVKNEASHRARCEL